MDQQIIMKIDDLRMYFNTNGGVFGNKRKIVHAVDDVSLSIMEGETIGIVGESGCGKTTFGRAILRLYKPTGGSIEFMGQNITDMPERKLRQLRSKMVYVFQDPYESLDPRKTVGSTVGEPLIINHLVRNKKEYEKRIAELFEIVNLDPSMANRYPHEFSGGQRQRVAIARSLASDPKLIVFDEAVSALDVSLQARIVNLLADIKERLKITYIFISHDLSVVKHISDRIAVFYLGRVVELSEADELYKNPLHPYTKALLTAVPIPDPFLEDKRDVIFMDGEIPSPINPPKGCPFHPRCPFATDICRTDAPQLVDMGHQHLVACYASQEGRLPK
ncbi:MAG: ATP-binding cassette domain-containing protein [Parasporobacterium sp.]|nr:ATP-binding cassette domain-containing protein [Parasporobacterium sp.]